MSTPQHPTAILLMAMGGPDSLDNVEPFLLDVRGGRPTPPELVEEIRERYRATGGKSPAVGITQEVAKKLERRLNEFGSARYRVYVGCGIGIHSSRKPMPSCSSTRRAR